PDIDAVVLRALTPFCELTEIAAATHVDADCQPLRACHVAVAQDAAHELRQQVQRDIVRAVVVQVLERLEGDRLSRTGQAADDDQGGRRGRVHGMRCSNRLLWRAMNIAAGSMPLVRRICRRVAASVSTARLRPGITGRVISGTSRSSTWRLPESPVRRS